MQKGLEAAIRGTLHEGLLCLSSANLFSNVKFYSQSFVPWIPRNISPNLPGTPLGESPQSLHCGGAAARE